VQGVGTDNDLVHEFRRCVSWSSISSTSPPRGTPLIRRPGTAAASGRHVAEAVVPVELMIGARQSCGAAAPWPLRPDGIGELDPARDGEPSTVKGGRLATARMRGLE